jgi:hypothetical protein
MASQNRATLDAAANVIKNETAVGANTAVRVGTMVEDLADSALILAERQVGCTAVTGGSTSISFGTTNVKVTVTTVAQLAVNCTAGTNATITTGATPSQVTGMVQAVIHFSTLASRRLIFYVALNNTIQTISLAEITTNGTHQHSVICQFMGNIFGGNEISIYGNAPAGTVGVTINSINLTYHTV